MNRKEMLASIIARNAEQEGLRAKIREESARQEYSRLTKKRKDLKHSSQSLLPLDVWTKIFMSLCDDYQENLLFEVQRVAKDLSNAARVNKELYAASLPAFQHLGTKCRCIRWLFGRSEEALFDAFVSDPTSIELKDLQILCKAFRMREDESKEVLTVELMKKMELKHPTPHPARLIMAMKWDREYDLIYSDLYY